MADLWRSGELVEAARGCRTVYELAEKFGITSDGLNKALWRLRAKDPRVPTAASLVYGGPTRWQPDAPHRDLDTVIGDAVNRRTLERLGDQAIRESFERVDEWDEPTNPGMPPEAVAEMRVVPEEIDAIEEHRLRRQVRELEARIRELTDQLLNTRDLLGVQREAAQHRVEPLAMREHRSGKREGASLILLSDCHVDEIVERGSVNGLNEHNPDIARMRMARVFEGARWLTQHARQSHLVRDVILWIGGDLISGTIHEDLRETNAMGLPESIAFATQLAGDGIRHLLADPETEHVRVVCSTGNHGRLAPGKPRIHTRNETNAETIIYLSLAREFAGERRVTFHLPEGVFSYFQVYGRTVRASHGDHLKYSGALGGLTNPINRAIARMNMARHADLDLFGHWHTYFDAGTWIVNGATVGYGPFSEWIHCPYERPQQAWALLDAKRWRSLCAPIWCDSSEEAAAA